MYSDVVCNIIASPDHIIRNYYIVEDTSGVFSLFSGIASLEFSENDVAIGTGRYVYQGGSDLHSGILGKVITTYEKDIIKHDFCIQGSTYDNIVAPLK